MICIVQKNMIGAAARAAKIRTAHIRCFLTMAKERRMRQL